MPGLVLAAITPLLLAIGVLSGMTVTLLGIALGGDCAKERHRRTHQG